MPVTHSDLMDLASEIFAQEDLPEIHLRNAAGRAYYALYHAARARIHALGIPILRVDGAGSHEALINTIRLSGPTGKSIADDMERLKKFRHKCDYELGFPIPSLRVQKEIAAARRLIGIVGRLEAR